MHTLVIYTIHMSLVANLVELGDVFISVQHHRLLLYLADYLWIT